MNSVPCSDGMATFFACATHRQSRGSGYPHPLFLFERGWPPPLLITYLKVEGADIPICFSFWRIGGHLHH